MAVSALLYGKVPLFCIDKKIFVVENLYKMMILVWTNEKECAIIRAYNPRSVL